jgi:hypothetical protein
MVCVCVCVCLYIYIYIYIYIYRERERESRFFSLHNGGRILDKNWSVVDYIIKKKHSKCHLLVGVDCLVKNKKEVNNVLSISKSCMFNNNKKKKKANKVSSTLVIKK